MSFFASLWNRAFGTGGNASPEMAAASQLAPVQEPKPPRRQQSIPSFLTSAKPTDSAMPQRDRRLINTDIETYRNGRDTRTVVRDLAQTSPDLAAAVFAYVRTGLTEKYTGVAKNMDGTFNREATALLQQLLTRMDVLGDYTDGFSGIYTLRTLCESLAKELVYYGGYSYELVLDKARLPRGFVPISITTVQFKPDTKIWGMSPIQVIGGEEIDLDIPTFFYIALDQDLTQPYSDSFLEPALQPILFSSEFMNDLRRVVKKAIHPRATFTIDEEKFRKYVPSEIAHDPAKLVEYMANVISDLEGKVNNLRPEDALVFFDTIGVDVLNNGNISLDAEYKVLSEIIDAKVSTGAKTLPSILGHGSGSQNIASSETMMFLKSADGAIRQKINEGLSKGLTLAMRLFGLDVYVEFRLEDIDLRPRNELEAFYAMRQSRLLELLSLGFLTDDEASLQLTGQLTPAGFKPLSGTGFHNQGAAVPTGNANNGTAGEARNQSLKPGTPEQKKGPVKVVK